MRIIPSKLKQFEHYMREEERSEATIEKYIRDVRHFALFVGKTEISKQSILEYKACLREKYAVSSANSMLAALNSFFRFCDRHDLCVKQFKMQRQAYCSEENKEK